MDYTQRTNKLAHHVALTENERTPGGPAAALASPGFCVTRWESGPQVFPEGRLPTPAARPLEVCRAWREITGDAGWAGVLAEAANSRPPRTATIIFAPGRETLSLVVEALALVPPQRRWEVTFSTYFTRLPAGLDCHWRFVLAGSPEANAARANPHALVIDLTRSLGPASGGRLVEAARSGILPEADAAHQVPAVAAAQSVPHETFETPPRHQTSSSFLHETEERTYALKDRDEPKPIEVSIKTGARRSPTVAAPRKSSPLKWTFFAAAALIATIGLFGGGAAVVFYFFGEKPLVRTQPLGMTDSSKNLPKEAAKTQEQPEKTGEAKNNRPVKSEWVETAPKEFPKIPRALPHKSPTDDGPKPPSVSGTVTKVPKPEPDPFEAIEKRRKLLRLPPLPDFGSSSAPQKLVDLKVSDPERLQWRLLGAHQVFDDKTELEITPDLSSTKSDSPTWAVNRQFATSLGSEKVRVGTLLLKSGELQYLWAPDLHRRALDINKLRYCLLEISYGHKKVVLQFDSQNPAAADIRVSDGTAIRKTVSMLENVKLDKNDRPLLENLLVKVLDLKVARQPGDVTIKRLGANPLSFTSSGAAFRFVHSKTPESESGRALLELQIKLIEVTDANIKLKVTLNCFSQPYDGQPLVATKDGSPTPFDEKTFGDEKRKNEKELKRCRKLQGDHKPREQKERVALELESGQRESNKRWFDRVMALYGALKGSTTLSFELSLPIEDGLPEVLVLKSQGHDKADHASARNGGS